MRKELAGAYGVKVGKAMGREERCQADHLLGESDR